jgi:hypothetical protein
MMMIFNVYKYPVKLAHQNQQKRFFLRWDWDLRVEKQEQ